MPAALSPTSQGAPTVSAAPVATTSAPEVSLLQVYQEGAAAFARTDYATAAERLQMVVDQAPAGSRNLETVYLTLAAAYLRGEQYSPATATLKKFLELFPASASRNEAVVSLGYAALKAGDFSGAIEGYQQLQANPKFRERALLGQGRVYIEWEQYDKAIATLRMLVGTGVRSAAAAEGLLLLSDAYARTKNFEKAIASLQKLRGSVEYLPNIFRLNKAAFRLGDQLLNDKEPALALDCYHVVLSKQKVIALQTAGLLAMKKQVTDNVQAMRADPTKVAELIGQNTFLAQSIGEASKTLAEYQGVPDFSPAYLLRLARAHAETRQHWEALTIYGEFLRRYPQDPQREEALYGATLESAETGRVEETQRYAEVYLHEFPDHPNADAIGYLLGSTALLAKDPQSAETYFGRMLTEQPDSKFKDQIRFQLGNARFDLGKYELALSDYRRYVADYPEGLNNEEARYRIGICQLLLGQYDNALKTITAYLAAHSGSFFLPDARYRIAVCKFSLNHAPEVIVDCDAWLQDYPGAPLTAEVLALKADALVDVNRTPEAIDAYQQAYDVGKNDGVIAYSLFTMKRLLQKTRNWKRIEEVFTDFVNRHPDHPAVLSGISTVTQAKARQGRNDEARQYVADAILATIGDARRETVEELISQFTALCAKSRASAADPKKASESQADFDRLVAEARASKTPVTQARLLFAKAELSRQRKDPAGTEAALKTLASTYEPEALSPALQAITGDYLLKSGNPQKAKAYYDRLLKFFPKSTYREYANVGLGEIALKAGRNEEALGRFQTAIEKDGARARLKEATLGKANALLALGRLDEARALYEVVASTREWRGEATATSIFSLGEIEKREGNLPKAITYYEKVYQGYRLYLPWVAKAYQGSAACFEKLGDSSRARGIYEEFVRNEKLSPFPEHANARKRLQELNDKG